MTSKCLSSVAEEYLYSINPLAQRIGEDVTATKEAYEGLWNALSIAEKNQAIDETIIQPEVALKYTLKNLHSSKDLPEWYPKLRIQTGLKYVIDETGSTLRWRDEHSGPFSFMTQSQMNLNLSDTAESPDPKPGLDYGVDSSRYASPRLGESSLASSSEEGRSPSDRLDFYRTDGYSGGMYDDSETGNLLENSTSEENTGSLFTKLMNKRSLLDMANNSVNDEDDDEDNADVGDTEILVSHKNISIRQARRNENANRNHMNINLNGSHRKSSEINESTGLLETPSSYSSFQSSRTLQEDGIPKTGFEFLDNW